MSGFRAVLLDIGGVVTVGDAPLPGAIDAITRLRDAGLSIRYLTNTTRSAHTTLLASMQGAGIPVEAEELFTPAMAARRLLKGRGIAPHLLVHPDLEADFAGLEDCVDKALVLGDAGEGFTYDALNQAFRVLQTGAPFLALANNRSFRDADGGLSLDAGPFVAALSFASEREPVVLGKPSREFFNAALASVGCQPAEAVMVGDDAENDIGGALSAGLSGILVRTGKYETGAEDTIDPPPTALVDDLPAAVDWILAQGIKR